MTLKRDDLPSDVRHFLETSIDSIEQLQVLLLLYLSSDRVWSTSEITLELRSTETSIAKRINDLYERKILLKSAESEKHQFSPTTPEMKKLIESVAYQNQLRPYQIIDAIYSTSSKSIKAFADAFKVRGDKS